MSIFLIFSDFHNEYLGYVLQIDKKTFNDLEEKNYNIEINNFNNFFVANSVVKYIKRTKKKNITKANSIENFDWKNIYVAHPQTDKLFSSYVKSFSVKTSPNYILESRINSRFSKRSKEDNISMIINSPRIRR